MFLLFIIYIILTSAGSALVNLGTGISFSTTIPEDGAEIVNPNFFFLSAGVIVWLISMLLIATIYKGFITTDDEEKVSLGEFFSLDRKVFAGFFTSIVVSIIFIIPAAFLALGYVTNIVPLGETSFAILAIAVFVFMLVIGFYLSYAPYYSLEDGVEPFTAMRRSFTDVSRSPLYVLGLMATMIIIMFFSAMLILPIFFVAPMSMVVAANSYRAISGYRTDNIVKNIDRMFAPAVEPADDDATRDINAILREKNVDTL